MKCNDCGSTFEYAIIVPQPHSYDVMDACPECHSPDIENEKVAEEVT